MTSTDLTTIESILRDLVAGIVKYPEKIEIAKQPALRSCYWMMRVALEDESKAVGADGSHVKALAALLRVWGAAEGEQHTFRLITKGVPVPRERETAEDVMSYDTEPARALLLRCLENLDLDAFNVDVGPGDGARDMLTFKFTIRVWSSADYGKLIRTFGVYTKDGEATIIGSLGTLFRAIARKDGVKIDVAVRDPAAPPDA